MNPNTSQTESEEESKKSLAASRLENLYNWDGNHPAPTPEEFDAMLNAALAKMGAPPLGEKSPPRG